MGIKNLTNDVLFVELPSKGSKITAQLMAVNEAVSRNGDQDVIIDFSRVEIINSANISNLLILHKLQEGCRRQLVLCNVSTVTKCIFVVAGLNTVFNFVDSRSKALEAVAAGNDSEGPDG